MNKIFYKYLTDTEVFILDMFYGFTRGKLKASQIAEVIGTTQKAVFKRLERIRRKLKNEDIRRYLLKNLPEDQHNYIDYSSIPLLVCYTCGESYFKEDIKNGRTTLCGLCQWKRYAKELNKHNKTRNVNEYKSVWEHYAGEKIPRGWHIHHLDNDRTNNSRDNLVCVSPEMHYQIHNVLAYRYKSAFDKRAATLLKTKLNG